MENSRNSECLVFLQRSQNQTGFALVSLMVSQCTVLQFSSGPFLIFKLSVTWRHFIYNINVKLLPCNVLRNKVQKLRLKFLIFISYVTSIKNSIGFTSKHTLDLITSCSHHFFFPPLCNNSPGH